MLVQIDENSATLTPFGSLARHIPTNATNAETKSWSELLRSARQVIRRGVARACVRFSFGLEQTHATERDQHKQRQREGKY